MPQNNKRIILFSTSMSFGGAETQVKNIALGLARRDWAVQVISMLPPEAYQTELEEQGVALRNLGISKRRFAIKAISEFRRYVRQWNPSIVHSHMVHANVFSRVALTGEKVPLICTAHHTYEAPTKTKTLKEKTFREILYRVTDPLCNLTTQICTEGLERYIRIRAVPPNKIKCVYNGIDIREFSKKKENRESVRKDIAEGNGFLWLSVGRLDQQKDFPNLIKAFRHFSSQYPDDRLIIVGDGKERENLETLIRTLGLNEKVRLLGKRKDVYNVMQAADAFVLPSFYEGLPLVLLEAQASELPIVATRVGGVPEIVRDNENGFLCSSRDPMSLSSSMLKLRSLSPMARETMGRSGRAHAVKHFDLEIILDQWESLYKQYCKRN